MKPNDWLTLWHKGKDCWNSYINENPEFIDFSDMDFSGQDIIDFSGYNFPNGVSFNRSNLVASKILFSNTIFFDNSNKSNHSVIFSEAKIEADLIEFREANFGNAMVDFSRIKFRAKKIDFSGTIFNGEMTVFSESNFNCPSIKFTKTTFNCSQKVDFSGCKFNGDLSFSNSKIKSSFVSFHDVDFGPNNISICDCEIFGDNIELKYVKKYKNPIVFKGCQIKGSFSINASILDASIIMNELTLDGSFDCKNNIFNYSVALKFKHVTKNSFLSLKNSTFNSNLTIEGCFYEIPDLRNTYIKNHMSLGELEIKPKYSNVSYSMKNYPIKIKTPFKIANSDEDHDKIRRLKELLEINRAHQRALDFHVLEIKARRWHITKLISQIPEYLFGAFSDYGRSLLKPLSYFVSLKIICSVFYSHLSNTDCCTIGESLAKSFLYSLSSSLGFISQAKDVREINQSLLFNPIPDTVQALSIFEGIFSAILIFLFILSLRNRFRI